jgi:hypothetical protein
MLALVFRGSWDCLVGWWRSISFLVVFIGLYMHCRRAHTIAVLPLLPFLLEVMLAVVVRLFVVMVVVVVAMATAGHLLGAVT